jgi:hypothetical protein
MVTKLQDYLNRVNTFYQKYSKEKANSSDNLLHLKTKIDTINWGKYLSNPNTEEAITVPILKKGLPLLIGAVQNIESLNIEGLRNLSILNDSLNGLLTEIGSRFIAQLKKLNREKRIKDDTEKLYELINDNLLDPKIKFNEGHIKPELRDPYQDHYAINFNIFNPRFHLRPQGFKMPGNYSRKEYDNHFTLVKNIKGEWVINHYNTPICPGVTFEQLKDTFPDKTMEIDKLLTFVNQPRKIT